MAEKCFFCCTTCLLNVTRRRFGNLKILYIRSGNQSASMSRTTIFPTQSGLKLAKLSDQARDDGDWRLTKAFLTMLCHHQFHKIWHISCFKAPLQEETARLNRLEALVCSSIGESVEIGLMGRDNLHIFPLLYCWCGLLQKRFKTPLPLRWGSGLPHIFFIFSSILRRKIRCLGWWHWRQIIN